MLNHYSNSANTGLMAALLSALLVLSGCAMTGGGADVSPDPLASVPPATQKAYGRAVAKLAQGDDAEAAARLELFIAEHPAFANAYVNLAIVRMRQADMAAATALLEQALERDPNNVFALNQTGLIKRQQGDFAGAAAAWQQATLANPDYANAWYNLGVLNDLYLRDLPAALQNYQVYQNLTGAIDGDPAVARWIADLERRIGMPAQAARAEVE